MILSKYDLNKNNIKYDLKKLNKENFKIITNEYFLFNGILKDKIFKVNIFNFEGDLWYILKNELKIHYRLSLNYKYETINIYKLKIIRIFYKDDFIYYLKYIWIKKNEPLFYMIINRNTNLLLNNFKKKLNKIVSSNYKKIYLPEQNNIDFKKIYKNNEFSKLTKIYTSLIKKRKKLVSLLKINYYLKLKLEKGKKETFNIFLNSTNSKNELKKFKSENNQLNILINNFRKMKEENFKILKIKKKSTLKIKEKLMNNIKIEFCNYKIEKLDF